jgi:hypothetical protein
MSAFPALSTLAFPGGAAGPSAAGGTLTSGFDSSGWNVNFGAGRIESAAGAPANLAQWTPYILAGLALYAVWKTRKRNT